jgi:hypothetical protein
MTKNTYTCRICGKEFISSNSVPLHNHIEKEHDIKWLSYLREYHPELGGYCFECGKETRFISYDSGFKRFCSQSCSTTYVHKHRTVEEKNNIKNKKIQTNLERYGGNAPASSDEVKEKASKTKLEKYGSETYNNRDQAKETCLNKYGAENPFQAEEIKEKIKQTNLERHGVENPAQSEIIKNKARNTNLERYGVEYPRQSETVTIKLIETNRRIYGTDYPFQNKIFYEKLQNIFLEKYNCTSPMKNKNIAYKSSRVRRNNRYDFFKTQIFQFKNIELLDTKEEYINNDVHRYSCSIHGEFESTAVNFQDVFCKKCSVQKTTSKLEKEVSDFLSHYVSTIETSNRTILSGKELDIWIPEKKLAIEFDGLYWHSNVYKEKNYHLEKTLFCEEQNIQLIHIFENEWLNKRPIVESILLAKLGIFQKRIYGRKCSVTVVSTELYREFVELNHLQGYVPAKLVLGLFHEDELVEICSFGKSRFKSGEMELLRHCSKLHYQIVGGFSKLIKSWKKLNPDQELFTYCDRRYSNGSSYEKSGWTKVSESAPNYFYK